MKPRVIRLFMWAYQSDFRKAVQRQATDVLKELGVPDTRTECLLVGVRIPGREVRNGVCVEPEDGKWPPDLFSSVIEATEEELKNDGDVILTNADDWMRKKYYDEQYRLAAGRAVLDALRSYDSEHQVRSLAWSGWNVGDHIVLPVLQLPEALFERFRPLREPIGDGDLAAYPSLIHAAIGGVLAKAREELQRPDPGRDFIYRPRSIPEIIRKAGATFMRTPGVAMNAMGPHQYLFEQFNLVSTSTYEGVEGEGRLLLANPDDGFMRFFVRFGDPISFDDLRGLRKALQMSSADVKLLTDCQEVLGLGRVSQAMGKENLSSTSGRVFEVEFVGHHHWRLWCGNEVLLVSRNGVPSLPRAGRPAHLADTYQRLFPGARDVDVKRFLDLFDAAVGQGRGSMLVVAEDAKEETERLRSQATVVEPVVLTSGLYEQVSRIDGAILVDPFNVCHAVGLILDGVAQPECTSSRGARYNSGVRYVYAAERSRLAIVVSDDGMVDVIPELRPRVTREGIEESIAALEAAGLEDGRSAANLVDQRRFYLSKEQCVRANRAVERIHREMEDAGEFWFTPEEFGPDPRCDASYFRDEAP